MATFCIQARSNNDEEKIAKESVDYEERGQWLRAAVLGANDGLLSTASLMMGVGAVNSEAKAMVLSGMAALVAGACSMAIGEFVSVSTQRDIESAALRRRKVAHCQSASASPEVVGGVKEGEVEEKEEKKETLPNPLQAAGASAMAFAVGSLVPLLSGAFISRFAVRVGVLASTSTVALALFGGVGAHFGGASPVMGSLRVLVGGWMAILVTYGILKCFASFAQW